MAVSARRPVARPSRSSASPTKHERLVLVVGDEQRRHRQLPEQLGDLRAHVGPQVGVETGEGLVEEKDPRLRREGTGERDPLLLTTRERTGQSVGEIAHPDHLEQGTDPGTGLGIATPEPAWAHGPRQPIGDVGGHRQMREQGPVLEHETDPTILCGYVYTGTDHLVPAEPDLSAVDPLEPCDRPQERGLATTAGAENGRLAAGRRLERHAPQYGRATEIDARIAYRNSRCVRHALHGTGGSLQTETGPTTTLG
jgi:hypothetical protein